MRRKEIFVKGSIYHIFNRSIAGFKILKDENNTLRFIEVIDYYNNIEIKKKYSELSKNEYLYSNLLIPKVKSIVKIISYCIMPDHYHLLIKILKDNLLSKYLAKLENSFAKYFNLKFNRKGPLWEGRFKAVEIKTNKQLIHVSRYVHINPTTANLVAKPEDWPFSSYKDLVSDQRFLKEYLKEISISTPVVYKKFVENNIDYQKKLGLIKKLMID